VRHPSLSKIKDLYTHLSIIDGRQVLKYSFDNFVYERPVIDVPFGYVNLFASLVTPQLPLFFFFFFAFSAPVFQRLTRLIQ